MTAIHSQVTNFFLAMQAGPHGADRLRAMFTEDAVYREPFSGSPEPHLGPEAIAAAFSSSRSEAFNDAVVQLGEISIDGAEITVTWTCFSQAIPGGQGSGTNVFRMRDGQIAALTTTLDMPA